MATCKDCIHYDICIFHLNGDEANKCRHFVNTADVVPKSEVDKTIAEWAYLHADVLNKLETSRAEVAREIFEEIEKAIASMAYKANTPRKIVKIEELSEQVDWVLHEVVPRRIAKLKKKYTEGE